MLPEGWWPPHGRPLVGVVTEEECIELKLAGQHRPKHSTSLLDVKEAKCHVLFMVKNIKVENNFLIPTRSSSDQTENCALIDLFESTYPSHIQ